MNMRLYDAIGTETEYSSVETTSLIDLGNNTSPLVYLPKISEKTLRPEVMSLKTFIVDGMTLGFESSDDAMDYILNMALKNLLDTIYKMTKPKKELRLTIEDENALLTFKWFAQLFDCGLAFSGVNLEVSVWDRFIKTVQEIVLDLIPAIAIPKFSPKTDALNAVRNNIMMIDACIESGKLRFHFRVDDPSLRKDERQIRENAIRRLIYYFNAEITKEGEEETNGRRKENEDYPDNYWETAQRGSLDSESD